MALRILPLELRNSVCGRDSTLCLSASADCLSVSIQTRSYWPSDRCSDECERDFFSVSLFTHQLAPNTTRTGRPLRRALARVASRDEE